MEKENKEKLHEVLWKIINSGNLVQIEGLETVNVTKSEEIYQVLEIHESICTTLEVEEEYVTNVIESYLDAISDERAEEDLEFYEILEETYNAKDICVPLER